MDNRHQRIDRGYVDCVGSDCDCVSGPTEPPEHLGLDSIGKYYRQASLDYVSSDCDCDCIRSDCDCDCIKSVCDCDCDRAVGRNTYLSELGCAVSILPRKYYLMLTVCCNHRCSGCANPFFTEYSSRRLKHGSLDRPLSLLEWSRVLGKIAPHLKSLVITGGEPTLHPDFKQIIERIEQLAIPFTIFTNADWKHPKRLVSFLSESRHLRGLLVSLHGIDKMTHQAFTGIENSFDRTLVNIRLATDAGLPVRLSTVITGHNIRQFDSLVELAHHIGASGIAFNRYLISSQQHLAQRTLPPEDEFNAAFRRIDALCNRNMHTGFQVVHGGPRVPQCFSLSSMWNCSSGETFCAIDPWGNVLPCTHAGWKCGNLLEQGIEEIWDSETMQRWRNMVPSDCQGCREYSKCRGGCRAAMTLYEGRDPLMRGPIA